MAAQLASVRPQAFGLPVAAWLIVLNRLGWTDQPKDIANFRLVGKDAAFVMSLLRQLKVSGYQAARLRVITCKIISQCTNLERLELFFYATSHCSVEEPEHGRGNEDLEQVALALPPTLKSLHIYGITQLPQRLVRTILGRCPRLESLTLPFAIERSLEALPGEDDGGGDSVGAQDRPAPSAGAGDWPGARARAEALPLQLERLVRPATSWAMQQLPATLQQLTLTGCSNMHPTALLYVRDLTQLKRLAISGLRLASGHSFSGQPGTATAAALAAPPGVALAPSSCGDAASSVRSSSGVLAAESSLGSAGLPSMATLTPAALGAAGSGGAAAAAADGMQLPAVAGSNSGGGGSDGNCSGSREVMESLAHWSRLVGLRDLELISHPDAPVNDPWDCLLPVLLPALPALTRLAFHPPALHCEAAALAPVSGCSALRALELGCCGPAPLVLGGTAWRALAAASALEHLLVSNADSVLHVSALEPAGQESGVVSWRSAAAAPAAAGGRAAPFGVFGQSSTAAGLGGLGLPGRGRRYAYQGRDVAGAAGVHDTTGAVDDLALSGIRPIYTAPRGAPASPAAANPAAYGVAAAAIMALANQQRAGPNSPAACPAADHHALAAAAAPAYRQRRSLDQDSGAQAAGDPWVAHGPPGRDLLPNPMGVVSDGDDLYGTPRASPHASPLAGRAPAAGAEWDAVAQRLRDLSPAAPAVTDAWGDGAGSSYADWDAMQASEIIQPRTSWAGAGDTGGWGGSPAGAGWETWGGGSGGDGLQGPPPGMSWDDWEVAKLLAQQQEEEQQQRQLMATLDDGGGSGLEAAVQAQPLAFSPPRHAHEHAETAASSHPAMVLAKQQIAVEGPGRELPAPPGLPAVVEATAPAATAPLDNQPDIAAAAVAALVGSGVNATAAAKTLAKKLLHHGSPDRPPSDGGSWSSSTLSDDTALQGRDTLRVLKAAVPVLWEAAAAHEPLAAPVASTGPSLAPAGCVVAPGSAAPAAVASAAPAAAVGAQGTSLQPGAAACGMAAPQTANAAAQEPGAAARPGYEQPRQLQQEQEAACGPAPSGDAVAAGSEPAATCNVDASSAMQPPGGPWATLQPRCDSAMAATDSLSYGAMTSAAPAPCRPASFMQQPAGGGPEEAEADVYSFMPPMLENNEEEGAAATTGCNSSERSSSCRASGTAGEAAAGTSTQGGSSQPLDDASSGASTSAGYKELPPPADAGGTTQASVPSLAAKACELPPAVAEWWATYRQSSQQQAEHAAMPSLDLDHHIASAAAAAAGRVLAADKGPRLLLPPPPPRQELFASLQRLAVQRLSDDALSALVPCLDRLNSPLACLCISDCSQLGEPGLSLIPRLTSLECLGLLGLTQTFDQVLGSWRSLRRLHSLELGMSPGAAAAAVAASRQQPTARPSAAGSTTASTLTKRSSSNARDSDVWSLAPHAIIQEGTHRTESAAGQVLLPDDLGMLGEEAEGEGASGPDERGDQGGLPPDVQGCASSTARRAGTGKRSSRASASAGVRGSVRVSGISASPRRSMQQLGSGSGLKGATLAHQRAPASAGPFAQLSRRHSPGAFAGAVNDDGSDAAVHGSSDGEASACSRGTLGSMDLDLMDFAGEGEGGNSAVRMQEEAQGVAGGASGPVPFPMPAPDSGSDHDADSDAAAASGWPRIRAAAGDGGYSDDGGAGGGSGNGAFTATAQDVDDAMERIGDFTAGLQHADDALECMGCYDETLGVPAAGSPDRCSSDAGSGSGPDIVLYPDERMSLAGNMAIPGMDGLGLSQGMAQEYRLCGSGAAAGGAGGGGGGGYVSGIGGAGLPKGALFGAPAGGAGGGGGSITIVRSPTPSWNQPEVPAWMDAGARTSHRNSAAGGSGRRVGGTPRQADSRRGSLLTDVWADTSVASPVRRSRKAMSLTAQGSYKSLGRASTAMGTASDEGRVHGHGAARHAVAAALRDTGLQLLLCSGLPSLQELHLHNLPHLTPSTLERVVSKRGLRLLAADGCRQLSQECCELLAISAMDLPLSLNLAPAPPGLAAGTL